MDYDFFLRAFQINIPDSEGTVCTGSNAEVFVGGVPCSSSDFGNVTFGVMHIPEIHISFDELSEDFSISAENLGLRCGGDDEDLTW